MAKFSQKQSFIGGAAVLTAAVIAVKLISALYKIPLGNILDDEGMGNFNVAYNVYTFLFTLSTAGLPLALSKMTSEALALGRHNQARKQLRVSFALFLVFGLAGFAVMFFMAKPLASLLQDSLAYPLILMLSPSAFCVCIVACFRGYTQGHGNMIPTAVSQVVESVFKLVVGLTLAWLLLRAGQSIVISGAGAILGVTVGCIIALIYLIVYMARHHDRTKTSDTPDSSGKILRTLLSIGIPITIGAAAINIISILDQAVVMWRLEDVFNLTEKAATALYGQYTFGMNLFNLPAAFARPLAIALIPAVTASAIQHNSPRAKRIITSSFRITTMLALPAGVGMSVLAEPILKLLYPAVPDTAAAATYHLQILGVASIFVCIMLLCNSILQACGHVNLPIIAAVIGCGIKVSVNYVLCGNPDFGIRGAPIGTLLCYVIIAALDLIFVAVYVKDRPSYVSVFAKPIIATALMGAASIGVFDVLHTRMHSSVAVLGAIVIAAALYCALVVLMRIVTKEDLALLPKGEKIARILHIK